MKKLFWMPLAVLAVFALAFVGCGGGDPDPDPDPDSEEAFTIELKDNWQYGEGYQGTVPINQLPGMKNTDQFKEDDVWYLGVKFTASRDLYAKMEAALVDPHEDAGYWLNLIKEDPEDEDEALPIIGPSAEPWIKAGEEYGPFVIKFEVLRNSTGAGGARNILAINTKDTDGTKGTTGSGSHGPVTLSFTMFNFADNEDDALKEPEPEVPSDPTFTAYEWDEDYFADDMMSAELPWNDDAILPVIKAAKADSYFEIVFTEEIDSDENIGDIATYIAANGYAGNKHVFPNLDGEDTYKVTLGDVLNDMELTAAELGGIQVQLFDDKVDAVFKSITFYDMD